jgi:hypothetical protein
MVESRCQSVDYDLLLNEFDFERDLPKMPPNDPVLRSDDDFDLVNALSLRRVPSGSGSIALTE